MVNAKGFFGKSINTEQVSCPVLTHINDAGDCEQKKNDFISILYNGNTGNLSIISTANRPLIHGEILYDVYIDGAKNEASEANSILSFSKSGLSSILSNGSHTVKISAYSQDKSSGCDFMYAFSIDKSNIKLNRSGNDIEVVYDGLPDHMTLNLSSLTYDWKVDGVSAPSILSGINVSIDPNRLSLVSSEPEVEITVDIAELGIQLKVGTVVIDRNRHSMTMKMETVVNGRDIFVNISSLVGNPVPGSSILYFIEDGHGQLDDTFRLHGQTAGKKIWAVLTMDPALASFNKHDLNSYISYIEQTTPTAGFTTSSFLDILVPDGIGNTTNPYKLSPIDRYSINDFQSFENVSIEKMTTADDQFLISSGSEVRESRTGEIYEVNGEIYCLDADLTARVVTRDNLVTKQIVMVDEEKIDMIQDVATLEAYFSETNTGLAIGNGWIYNSAPDSSATLSKQVSSRLIQLQFDLRYTKGAQNKMSKMMIYLYATGGTVYKYGLERNSNGTVRIHKSDRTFVDMTQDSFATQFVVRVPTEKTIESFSIVFSNTLNDSMAIRDIVITEEG